MDAAKRIPFVGGSKQKFRLQGTTSVVIDALPGERVIITSVYAAGAVSAFTVSNQDDGAGSTETVDFGDHPGLGDRVKFEDNELVGAVNTAVTVTTTGASRTVVFGYIVSDLST